MDNLAQGNFKQLFILCFQIEELVCLFFFKMLHKDKKYNGNKDKMSFICSALFPENIPVLVTKG